MGDLFGASERKGKEDWRGTWLERDMIGEENDWRGKWVWDNWYFKWSQKTERWERGTSFPRVTWSLVPHLTKHKRCALFTAFLSLCPPRLQSEEPSSWWVSVIDDYLQESDSLFLLFFCVFWLFKVFFFPEKERRAKNLTAPKQRILWTSLFYLLLEPDCIAFL